MPRGLPNMVGYLALPENAAARLGALFIGDPAALGAVRINPRAADPAYQEALRAGFYNDLRLAQATPFLQLLTPDLPLHVAVDAVYPTVTRWGAVPRTYVRTLRDQALPLALQERQIAEADAFTPHNRFRIQTLDSGHSPFASQAQALALAERQIQVSVSGTGTGPSIVDKALAERNLRIEVGLRVASFLPVGRIVAESELLAFVPRSLGMALAERECVQVLDAPIAFPRYPVRLYWHERFHADPGHGWLRQLIAEQFQRGPGDEPP